MKLIRLFQLSLLGCLIIFTINNGVQESYVRINNNTLYNLACRIMLARGFDIYKPDDVQLEKHVSFILDNKNFKTYSIPSYDNSKAILDVVGGPYEQKKFSVILPNQDAWDIIINDNSQKQMLEFKKKLFSKFSKKNGTYPINPISQ